METAVGGQIKQTRQTPRKGFFRRLGPGLVTGASDDDPSGVGTYSQAGAHFGYALLWTMLFTLPLMAAIQEISARIGRITGRGIAGNLRRHYSPWLLYPLVLLLVIANTFNLGADIGAMGDALTLIIGGPALLYCAMFALGCVTLEVFVSYPRYAKVLKWLTLALLSYVATAFLVHVPWRQAARAALIPSIKFEAEHLSMLIAILGTTISPYLFFWQASQESQEIQVNPDEQPLASAHAQARRQLRRIRLDTYIGMAFSNLVALFIILSSAATLYAHGVREIDSSAQAAEALRPLAGRLTVTLFTLGIVGTGLLAVPVLAGSAAYAVGEAFQWPTGLDRKPMGAKRFYGVLTAATFIGLAMNFPIVQRHVHLSPLRALFWAAVLNGVVAVPMMIVMMLMCHNRQVLGQFTRISKSLRLVGWLSTAVMAAAAAGMFLTWKW